MSPLLRRPVGSQPARTSKNQPLDRPRVSQTLRRSRDASERPKIGRGVRGAPTAVDVTLEPGPYDVCGTPRQPNTGVPSSRRRGERKRWCPDRTDTHLKPLHYDSVTERDPSLVNSRTLQRPTRPIRCAGTDGDRPERLLHMRNTVLSSFDAFYHVLGTGIQHRTLALPL